MIKEWYLVNVKTGDVAEAIEPISLERFLKETGFGPMLAKDVYLGTKEQVNRRLKLDGYPK